MQNQRVFATHVSRPTSISCCPAGLASTSAVLGDAGRRCSGAHRPLVSTSHNSDPDAASHRPSERGSSPAEV